MIRTRRLELGLTQEQLAELIGAGMTQADVSRLERDQIELPRRNRLQAIAAAIGLPVGELLIASGWVSDEAGAQSVSSLVPLACADAAGDGAAKLRRSTPDGHGEHRLPWRAVTTSGADYRDDAHLVGGSPVWERAGIGLTLESEETGGEMAVALKESVDHLSAALLLAQWIRRRTEAAGDDVCDLTSDLRHLETLLQHLGGDLVRLYDRAQSTTGDGRDGGSRPADDLER